MTQCPNYDNETKITDLTVGDLKNILNSVLYEMERKRFIEEKQKEIYELNQKFGMIPQCKKFL